MAVIALKLSKTGKLDMNYGNYLQSFLVRKATNKIYYSASNGSIQNWWIVKIIVFFGTILGYTIFFAVASQIIMEDYKWYWKLLIILLSVGFISNAYKKISNWITEWKTK